MEGSQSQTAPVPGEPSPRQERRRRLQELSRTHLLDAAEHVFAEKGYEVATVKEIAELAQLSVGSVYQLFDSKQSMFRAIFHRRNGEGLDALREALSRVDSPYERLHTLIDATVDFYLEHRTFFLLFEHAIGGSWLNMKVFFDVRNFEEYLEFVALPADIFAQGTESGIFLSLDPQGMAVTYTGMLQAYLVREILEPGTAAPDVSSAPRMTRADLHAMFDRAFATERPG